jgi:hypothetical protein
MCPGFGNPASALPPLQPNSPENQEDATANTSARQNFAGWVRLKKEICAARAIQITPSLPIRQTASGEFVLNFPEAVSASTTVFSER